MFRPGNTSTSCSGVVWLAIGSLVVMIHIIEVAISVNQCLAYILSWLILHRRKANLREKIQGVALA